MSRISGLAELVRVMVLRGEVGLGELIVEPQLAERFGVGRASLREALRRLEGEGLLVSRDGDSMHVVELDEDALRETLQTRAALEALSARLAARRVREGRAAPAELDRLQGLANAADPVAPTDAPASAVLRDRSFHRAVDGLAANAACGAALDRLWDRLVLADAHAIGTARGHRAGDHGLLVRAIAAGEDAEAGDLVNAHVLAGLV